MHLFLLFIKVMVIHVLSIPGGQWMSMQLFGLIGNKYIVALKEANLFILFLDFWHNMLFIVVVLALLIITAIWYAHQKSKAQQRELQRLEEGQNKIRQQTAQDFHDEIGNKITRINLLTLMAEKKAENNAELLAVLKQIRTNTQMLYSGAKDVIWSLQKESNYLKEALLHIEQNAIALLQDTTIVLRIEEEPSIKNNILMPIDYGRNLMLIFKEALNNALKYSEANLLLLRFYEDIDNSIVLELEDNGKGFEISKSSSGNGLENMRSRAENIKAKFSIQSVLGQGTLIRLRMFPYSFQ